MTRRREFREKEAEDLVFDLISDRYELSTDKNHFVSSKQLIDEFKPIWEQESPGTCFNGKRLSTIMKSAFGKSRRVVNFRNLAKGYRNFKMKEPIECEECGKISFYFVEGKQVCCFC